MSELTRIRFAFLLAAAACMLRRLKDRYAPAG